MAIEQHIVDQFNTKEEEVSQSMMKIQHTNMWLNPLLDAYSEELQIIMLVLNNSILHHDLSSIFAIPMQWLSLATSTVMYNKTMNTFTFKFMSNKSEQVNQEIICPNLEVTVYRYILWYYYWTSHSHVQKDGSSNKFIFYQSIKEVQFVIYMEFLVQHYPSMLNMKKFRVRQGKSWSLCDYGWDILWT